MRYTVKVRPKSHSAAEYYMDGFSAIEPMLGSLAGISAKAMKDYLETSPPSDVEPDSESQPCSEPLPNALSHFTRICEACSDKQVALMP